MPATRANVEGRRARRRWARRGALAIAVGAVALGASACTGPLEAQRRFVPVTCDRSDADGNLIRTYETTVLAGVTIPTWVQRGDDVLVQDATLEGPMHADDWIVLRYKVAWGSPSSADFLRSPGDDRFDNVHRRTVTGPTYRDFGIRLERLFIVHPKDGSFVYDNCVPKAGVATTLASADIR